MQRESTFQSLLKIIVPENFATALGMECENNFSREVKIDQQLFFINCLFYLFKEGKLMHLLIIFTKLDVIKYF